MTSDKSYSALLTETRRIQLETAQEYALLLWGLYMVAAERIAEQARGDSLTEVATLQRIDGRLENLRADFAILLAAGMGAMAQAAADREREAEAMAGAPEDNRLSASAVWSETLSGGTVWTLTLSLAAILAVGQTAQRVFGDGLNLSDRLFNLDRTTRAAVTAAIGIVVSSGLAGEEAAAQIREALTGESATIRSQAMRIARTELATAYREAHLVSVTDPATGGMKAHLLGVAWRLSPSHPEPDICDIWASDTGDGLGPGNYLPENLPVSHPHCLCYTFSLLAEAEGDWEGLAARPDDVPESQVRYYAEKLNDPAARRRLGGG